MDNAALPRYNPRVSLLRPGKVSEFVANLRDKASRELAKPESGTTAVNPSFDVEHEKISLPDFNQDENGVSAFPGVWDPWVGNGRLPW